MASSSAPVHPYRYLALFLALLLGVYPSLVTDIIGPSVSALITDYQAALPVVDGTQLATN